MNRSAAESIATRIREVWGGHGPTINVWVDELEHLDETIARTALRQLKNTVDRCPSIARFQSEYREVRKSTGHDFPVCEMCDGAGWLSTEGFEAHGVAYTAVDRCRTCGGSGKARSAA